MIEALLNEAKRKIQTRQYYDVIKQLTPTLQKSESNENLESSQLIGKLYGVRAQAYFNLENYEEARKDFDKAYLVTHDYNYIYGYAKACGRCDNMLENAMQSYSQIEEFTKETADRLKAEYSMGYECRRHSLKAGGSLQYLAVATAAFKSMHNSEDYPLWDSFFHLFGMAYLESDCLEEALTVFETFIESNRHSSWAPILYSSLAFVRYKQYWRSDVKNTELLNQSIAHYQIAIENSVDNKTRAALYLRRSNAYLALHDLKNATDDCKQALNYDPSLAEAKKLLAFFETLDITDLTAIEQFFNKNIDEQLKNMYVEILMDRAKLLCLTGEYQEAIDIFTQLIELISDGKNNNLNEQLSLLNSSRGYARLEWGNFKDAAEDFSRAIELNPSFSPAYFGRAKALMKLPVEYQQPGFDLEQAKQDLTIIVKSDTTDHQAYHILGIVYQKLNKFEEAIKAFQMAIEHSKNIAQYYFNMASTKLGLAANSLENKKELLQDAATFFDYVIKLSPNSADAYVGKFQAIIGLNQLAKVHAELIEAQKQQPDSIPILLQLGIIHTFNSQGDPISSGKNSAKASECFKKVITFAPTLSLSYRFYGHLLQKYGNYVDAMTNFNKAIELNPNDEVVASCISSLQPALIKSKRSNFGSRLNHFPPPPAKQEAQQKPQKSSQGKHSKKEMDKTSKVASHVKKRQPVSAQFTEEKKPKRACQLG